MRTLETPRQDLSSGIASGGILPYTTTWSTAPLPESSTTACLTETFALKRTSVMSARIPGSLASVGVMTMEEHPISGAMSDMDSIGLTFVKMASSSGVEDMPFERGPDNPPVDAACAPDGRVSLFDVAAVRVSVRDPDAAGEELPCHLLLGRVSFEVVPEEFHGSAYLGTLINIFVHQSLHCAELCPDPVLPTNYIKT